ncbi:MAG: hypothetical protein EPO26_04070 [Chloroflexota bacterium]|nr:MAG: hypothetical protein EPO26_04070 [Chloroflexota bacterium]
MSRLRFISLVALIVAIASACGAVAISTPTVAADLGSIGRGGVVPAQATRAIVPVQGAQGATTTTSNAAPPSAVPITTVASTPPPSAAMPTIGATDPEPIVAATATARSVAAPTTTAETVVGAATPQISGSTATIAATTPVAAAPSGAVPTPATIGAAGSSGTSASGSGSTAGEGALPDCPRGSRFGFYAWGGGSLIPTNEIAAARQVCAGFAQVAVEWGQIEFAEGYNDAYFGKPAGFDSSRIAHYDSNLLSLVEAGMEPILLISGPPAWALVTPETQGPLLPDKVAKYADFVKRIAQRYATPPYNVRYIVLWPEPDHRGTLPSGCANVSATHRAWGDAPGDFAAMLRQVYPSVKAARPNVSLILGALAYDNWGGADRPTFNGGQCGTFNFKFLDDVIAAGGIDYFDVFAFNAYGVFAPGWEQNASGYDTVAKANFLAAKFPRLREKPWVVLEAGIWSTGPELPQRLPNGQIAYVAPTTTWQASYPAKLFARGVASDLKAVLWYGLRDDEYDVARGIADGQMQPKPVMTAFRAATLNLSGVTYLGGLPDGATLSGTAEGYRFRRSDGGSIAVAWAIGDAASTARVTIDLGTGGHRVLDVNGDPIAGVAATGPVTLDVTAAPVYVLSS